MVQFIDALSGFFILMMAILGFRRGLIEEFGRLFGLVLASVFALRFYVDLAKLFLRWVPVDSWVTFTFSYTIIFSLVLFLVRILTRLFSLIFLSGGSSWINRSLGTIFGFMKGALVVAMFFWFTELFPGNRTMTIIQKESRLAGHMINIRKRVVNTFHWADPLERGQEYIRKILVQPAENAHG
ncbi:MAG: CvpA family protein [Fidelibacterota bacterium]